MKLVAGHRKFLQICIFKADLLFKVNQKELTCTALLGGTCGMTSCWGLIQSTLQDGIKPQAAQPFSPSHCCLLLWFVRGLCPTWVMCRAHPGLVLLEHRNFQHISLLPAPEEPCTLVSAWGYISGLLERLLAWPR